jgi:hypothetical protein
MVIRHAEKPDTYNGQKYYGVNATGNAGGGSGRKRRSSEEIKRLVTEFETSGLRQKRVLPQSLVGVGQLAAPT